MAVPLPAATPDPKLEFADCIQFHTLFPAQASSFSGRLPPGFTIATDPTGIVHLAVVATSCASPAPANQLWISIPVTPPQKWANASVAQDFALEAYADRPDLVAWYHAHGAALVEACTCSLAAGSGPAMADTFTVTAAGNAYVLRTALSPDSGDFMAMPEAMYFATNGTLHRLDVEAATATNRGLGGAVLSYTGSGGAPPALPALLAHAVAHLAYAQRIEDLGAA
jgi:hypothetical protein